jgi:hypothetical protein
MKKGEGVHTLHSEKINQLELQRIWYCFLVATQYGLAFFHFIPFLIPYLTLPANNNKVARIRVDRQDDT